MKVDIVVPIYNSLEYVSKLLISINQLDCSTHDLALYLVNDFSNKETTEYLENFCSTSERYSLINNKQNLGYTKSLNRGFKAGTAEYIVQVNSDCELPECFLNHLCEAIKDNPHLFALSPMSNAASWQSIPETLLPNGRMAINETLQGLTVTQMNKFCDSYGTGIAEGQLLNGFCIAYKRTILRDIGYLDETAFPRGYGEEDDLHMRAANLGHKMGAITSCYVFHHKSKSFGSTQRDKLVADGRRVLNERYSDARVKRLANSMRLHPRLESIRQSSRAVNDTNILPLKKYIEIDWKKTCENRIKGLTSLVMPVYQGLDMTISAVESIFENTNRHNFDFELVLVDNGSDADCANGLISLKDDFPIKLIRNEDNLNFSMGCNTGFLNSRGENIVFINNDMLFPDSTWLQSIVDGLAEPSHGAVGIKLLYEDLEIQSSGLSWSRESNFPIDVKKGRNKDDVSGKQYYAATTGACLGIRADVFASIKGFDPLFVNGSEDLDLCIKLGVLKDLKILQIGDSYAVHLESKSPGRSKNIKQNRELFYKRWSGYLYQFCSENLQTAPADSLPEPIRMRKIIQ